MKSRVLFISRNFPPLVGGMERLALETVKQLAKVFDVTLLGPKGCGQAISEVKAEGVKEKPLWWFLLRVQLKSFFRAWWFKPVYVIGGSGLMAPAVVIAARISGSEAVVYVHGLDLLVNNSLYQTVFLPFIRRADKVIANSANTAELVRKAGVRYERIHVLHPGVDLKVQVTTDGPVEIEGCHICLSVGRLVERKGLAVFIDKIFPVLKSANPKILLLILGDEPSQALVHGAGERARCERAIERHGVRENVRFLGEVDEQTLTWAYQSADVLVFPVIDLPYDVEGFGMVAVEAAAHGLPTVAFNAGGVSDAVREGVSGRLIEPDDYPAFANAVLSILNQGDADITDETCRAHARQFSWEKYGADLRDLLAVPLSPPPFS